MRVLACSTNVCCCLGAVEDQQLSCLMEVLAERLHNPASQLQCGANPCPEPQQNTRVHYFTYAVGAYLSTAISIMFVMAVFQGIRWV